MTYTDAQHLLCVLMKDNPIQCDGIWGPKSKEAMAEFQKRFGIPADGMLTVESGKALRHAVAYWYDEVEVEPEAPSDEVDWDAVSHFTKDELACKCKRYNGPYCNGFPHKIQPLLVEILERCRDHFGTPIVVVSGLRCKQHNADSGGVSNSQHMYGEACDICVSGVNPETVLKWFQSQSDVRYAYRITDSDNIHFDIHPVGR